MSHLTSAPPIRSAVPRLQRVWRILPALLIGALPMAQTQSQDPKTPQPVKVQEQPKGSAQSSGGAGPGTGQAFPQTESTLTSPPAAANPGPPLPSPALSHLRRGMELAQEMAASAERRFPDYNKCETDFLALSEPAQAASPRLISNLEAYSAGFSKLRDALLLQQAALEKDADGQSLGRRLIMQDEAADFRAVARRVAEEIIALGQERDAVAKILADTSKTPAWTELRATCKKIQTAAQSDLNEWNRIIVGLTVDIRNEEYRIDPKGEMQRAAASASSPATDTLGVTAPGVEPVRDNRDWIVGKWVSKAGPQTMIERITVNVAYEGEKYRADLQIGLVDGTDCEIGFRPSQLGQSKLEVGGGYIRSRQLRSSYNTPMLEASKFVASSRDGKTLEWRMDLPRLETSHDCLNSLKGHFPMLYLTKPGGIATDRSTGNAPEVAQSPCAGFSGTWKWASEVLDEMSEAYLEVSAHGEAAKATYWQKKRKRISGSREEGRWSKPIPTIAALCNTNEMSLSMQNINLSLTGGGDKMDSVLRVEVQAGKNLLFLPREQQKISFARTKEPVPPR